MNSQVSEASFSLNNDNHNLYSNQPLNDNSLTFSLNQVNNLKKLAPTSPTLTPSTFKKITDQLFELQANLPSMDSDRLETKLLPANINHLNPLHSNAFPSDNSCSYDSLVESDDSLNQSYTIVDHSSNDLTKTKPRGSPKHRISNNSENLTSEEEEKRKLRRERNKLAAARCRKRRLDHTNNLLKQTEDLEEKKQLLENELLLLQQQKNDLEYCLQTHKSECKSSAMKQVPFTLRLL